MSSTTDYINGAYASREQDAFDMLEAQEQGLEIDGQDAYEVMDQYILGVSIKRIVDIDISTGGPAEWLEAELDSDGAVVAVTFRASWGSDSVRRTVSDGQPLFRLAEYYCELVSGE